MSDVMVQAVMVFPAVQVLHVSPRCDVGKSGKSERVIVKFKYRRGLIKDPLVHSFILLVSL